MTAAVHALGSGFARVAFAALVASGCGAFRQAPVIDSLRDWSAVPLAPDPALVNEAVDGSTCHFGHDSSAPIQVVLQDRRTPTTAAFIVTQPGWLGSCLLPKGTGATAGGVRKTPLPAMDRAIVIDESSSGTIGDAVVGVASGRGIEAITAVELDLLDGRVVTASVGGGHWLAWWPGEVRIQRLVARRSGDGAVILALDDPVSTIKIKG